MSSQHSHYAAGNEPESNLGGTARIGAELRQVRERVGWKLAEVAAELRIREPYLDAIERGDLEALPGPAYQVGFIRSYAQVLGLDGEEILRRFRAEGGVGAVKKPELSFLAPVPDRAVPSGAIVLLGVVLLLVGYGFWFLHTESDRTMAASVPAVPAQLAPLAIPPAPPAAKPVAPAVAQATQTAKPAIPATASIIPPALAPATTAAPPAGTSATPVQPATVAAGATPVAGAMGKTILATADSWVEVKDANGNILFSRVMHSGDSWPVPDMPGLTMTAGNAGGTEIANNGSQGQPLGGNGTVLRNYALTPGGATPASTAPAGAAPVNPPPGATALPSPAIDPAKGPN